MGWKSYGLDRRAQKLVLAARKLDEAKLQGQNCLGECYKMRTAVAFGLERFWGEHLRLKSKGEEKKANYWQETWKAFVEIMKESGVKLPDLPNDPGNTQAVESIAEQFWQLDIADQRVALALLTQLCDALVWWTQRFKPPKKSPRSPKQQPTRKIRPPIVR